MAHQESRLYLRFNQVRCNHLFVALALTAVADVKELFHFVRSPTWILPPQEDRVLKKSTATILSGTIMNGNKFTQQQINRFTKDPAYYKSFIKATEEQVNALFKVVRYFSLTSVPIWSANK